MYPIVNGCLAFRKGCGSISRWISASLKIEPKRPEGAEPESETGRPIGGQTSRGDRRAVATIPIPANPLTRIRPPKPVKTVGLA